MKRLILYLILIFGIISINAQNIKTNGKTSPVLVGANGKVDYVKKQVVNNKIPSSLAPYLTGLLLSNSQIGSDKNKIDGALGAWFRKYKSLEQKINQATDLSIKQQARLRLDNGDFTSVENLLKVKTSSIEIIQKFPKSYTTNGDNSPIIIGDYATVTYVVTEIINYNLPEGLTINLLNELKVKNGVIDSQKTKLNDLSGNLESMRSTVKDYVARYNTIKEQLKNSPSKIYQEAYKYFKNGDFDGALKVLDQTSSNEVAIGSARILKAKILLLKLNSAKMDSTLTEIDRSYSVGVTLSPNTENYFDYGKFLIDYMGNYASAIPVLEKAEANEKNNLKLVYIYNYLGIAYSAVDRIKTNTLFEKALKKIEEMEPITERELILLKAQLQANIGTGFASMKFDKINVNKAILYFDKAINEVDRIPVKDEETKLKTAYFRNEKGKYYGMINDTVNAMKCYRESLTFFENAYAQKPDTYARGLATVYYYLAEFYFGTGKPITAIEEVKKGIVIIEPRITVSSRVYFQDYSNLTTNLLKYYEAMGMLQEMLNTLHEVDRYLKPFVVVDLKNYEMYQAWVNRDLGEIYFSLKQMDSARKYLEPAHTYYVNNINALQFDKFKSMSSLYRMNEVWSLSGESDKALRMNRILLKKLQEAEKINQFAYTDFLPHVERLFARTYTILKEKDSAKYHMKLAIDMVEPNAKQYCTIYLNPYSGYMIQELLINIEFGDFVEADNVEKRFLSNIQKMMDVDANVKNNLQTQIGDCVSNFAVQLFDFTQNKNNINPSDLNTLFNMMSSYFDDSYSYYKNGITENPTQGVSYALALSKAIYLEKNWMGMILDSNSLKIHQAKKCHLSREALILLDKQPINPYIDKIKQNISYMAEGCK